MDQAGRRGTSPRVLWHVQDVTGRSSAVFRDGQGVPIFLKQVLKRLAAPQHS